MNKTKALIPIVTAVLLICALSATYAWYVSTSSVRGGFDLSAREALEVELTNVLKSDRKYNGEMGYDADGVAYTVATSADPEHPDTPYYAWTDLEFRPKGGDAVAATFALRQAVIQLDPHFYFYDWLKTVRDLFDADADTADRSRWVGVYESEANFRTANDAGYYRADETGKMVELKNGAKIEKFTPPPDMGQDQKGFVIVSESGASVSHIVLVGASAAEYFQLSYALYEKTAEGFVLPSDAEHIAPWIQVPLCDVDYPTIKADAKVRIYFGYFATQNPTESLDRQKHATFAFSGNRYRGSTFRFKLRVNGEIYTQEGAV